MQTLYWVINYKNNKKQYTMTVSGSGVCSPDPEQSGSTALKSSGICNHKLHVSYPANTFLLSLGSLVNFKCYNSTVAWCHERDLSVVVGRILGLVGK